MKYTEVPGVQAILKFRLKREPARNKNTHNLKKKETSGVKGLTLVWLHDELRTLTACLFVFGSIKELSIKRSQH